MLKNNEPFTCYVHRFKLITLLEEVVYPPWTEPKRLAYYAAVTASVWNPPLQNAL